jgi:hypothetical protein
MAGRLRLPCEALISATVACARGAMNSGAADGIAWSPVPISVQMGMLVQADGPETPVSAVAATGDDHRELEFGPAFSPRTPRRLIPNGNRGDTHDTLDSADCQTRRLLEELHSD